jgi:hypothetical protein
MKDVEAEKDMLMARNRSLAEFNLSKEPQLAKGKLQVHELSETGATLCQRIENKVSQHSKFKLNVPLEWGEDLSSPYTVPYVCSVYHGCIMY